MPALTPVTFAWTLTAVVFALDLAVPSGGALRLLYLVAVLAGLWAADRWLAVKVATVATLLSLGHLASGAEGPAPPGQIFSQATALHGLWVVAAGVTLRRRTAEKVAEARRGHEQSVKDLHDIKNALDQSAIVATTNVRGDITYVNDKFCQISGYTREELIGANHRLINSGLHPPEFFQDLYRTITRGQVWRGEIRNRAKDGQLYWVDTTIVPFIDERGMPYRYTAVRYDITERKRTQAALRHQEALATLGRMAAVVAHEVRNPLAGIRGAVQVIARRMPQGAPEVAVVGEIVSRIDALNDIVEDLLLFARPNPLRTAPVAVREIVGDTLALLREDPRHDQAAIETDLSDHVVIADREQIKQVLLNVLLNALQATSTPAPVRISTNGDAARCEIVVRDCGPGVTEAVREHLFEPFFTTKSRGTGLGLATARRIVEAHGGTIDLVCPAEGGTEAVIGLPRASGAA